MTREEALKVLREAQTGWTIQEALETLIPELQESEDERIRAVLLKLVLGMRNEIFTAQDELVTKPKILAWLEKQKENPKSADSIPSGCTSDAKCEDRWHKVQDSLPDNGRLVLAQDCLGNTLLARYDGEGNWEVSVYDNDDYYCRNTITKWCEIPSEKQKEQKPAEWSEEDEKKIRSEEYTKGFNDAAFGGKAWGLSEGDEKTYKWVYNLFERGNEAWYKAIFAGCYPAVTREKVLAMFKSLHPSWKPSEEQEEALEYVIRDYREDSCNATANYLQEILDHLKNM